MTIFGSGDLPPARKKAARFGGQASLDCGGTPACRDQSHHVKAVILYISFGL
jgi:hypothetical protein